MTIPVPTVDIQAFRKGLRAAGPSIALFAAVLLMVTPLRLFQGYVPTPWLPMIIIFLYAVYDPDALPPWVVFAAGLFHDLLYGAGIGVWASVYLGLQYMVYSQHEYLDGRLPRVVWVAFGLAATICAFALYLLNSFLKGGFLPIAPLFYQLFITVGVYRLASMLFFYLRARADREEEENAA